MKKVLIVGGTGLVGSLLTQSLLEKGYQVSYLSRSAEPKNGCESLVWNVKKQFIDSKAFEGIDFLVNLAGAGIADERWTDERKKELLESRTQGTKLLINALLQRKHQIKAVVQASAVGYYGSDFTQTFTETSPAAHDFMATICEQWELACQGFSTQLGLRTAILRIGVVLGRNGGALEKLVQPFKFGAGAVLGSGRQYVSWIHEQDLSNMIVFALENQQVSGIYNAVAPAPVTNQILTQSIGKALKKPVLPIKVPEFALKLSLGEMAQVVLGSQRVSCQKISEAGFVFSFATPDLALKNLLHEPF